MHQGNLSKKISFRCSDETFFLIYNNYKAYKSNTHNVSFSNYIRKIVLSHILDSYADETEN